MMKTIKIIIEKSSDSYAAYAENVSGIFGAGDTPEECKQSINDAIKTIKTLDNAEIPNILKGEYKLKYRFDAETPFTSFKRF